MVRPLRIGVWLPVALAIFLGFREIGTADYWWQWSTGRYILENGIPHTDPWLTTLEPQPWIEMRWMYCVALYWSVEHVGSWLPIVSASLFYAAGIAFSLLAGGKAQQGWLAVIGVAAVSVMGRRLVVRPEAFTILFLGLLLFVILKHRQRKTSSPHTLVAIGLIQLFWANTHALFAIGIAVCALWLIVELFERSRQFGMAGIALVVAISASLINPYGLDGLLYPLLLFQELHVGPYKESIVELRNPFSFGVSPSLVCQLALAAIVAYFGFLRRGDVVVLCVCIAMLYLSLNTVRNAPLFAISACAYLSTCTLKPNKWAGPAAFATACVIAYSFGVGLWTLEDRFGFGINRDRYALKAAARSQGEEGPIFNTLVEGSLLIAQRQKVFADPRLEVLPPARFIEMLEIARLKRPFPVGYKTVLVSLDAPLAAKLAHTNGWRLLGLDSCGVAFTKDSSAVAEPSRIVEMALGSVERDPPPFSLFSVARSPVPYRRVSVFLRNMGETEAADKLLDTARKIYPRG